MEKRARQSEQFTDWTTNHARQINGTVARAAAQVGHTPADPHPARIARVTHHAVHAVWQAPLRLCPGPGAWTEILPLREQRGETTGDGVCPARFRAAGPAGAGAAPGVSGGPGGTLCPPPRVAEAAGNPVTRHNSVLQPRTARRPDRRGGAQPPGGHQARAGRARGLLARVTTGGDSLCPRR
jgi:hypothetical protein